MSFPNDLKYSAKHTWARVEGNVATVGISFYAQEQLGDLVFVEMPEVGASVTKDTPCGVVESAKVASDFNSPVTGKVIEINSELDDSPELMNEDCYGKGWFAKIELADAGEPATLLDAAGYQAGLE